MKRLIVAIILLICAVVFSVGSIWMQTNTLDEISADLAAIEQAYMAGDLETCADLTETLVNEYPERTAVLEWFIGHNHIYGVYDALSILPITLEEESDYTFPIKLEECKIQLEHLRERGLPMLENII